MNRQVEEAFNKGWIAIVPDGSVKVVPIQWKVILLNDMVKRNSISSPDRKLRRFEVLLLTEWQFSC